MRVRELMKFPKIRKLLEENWNNNGFSGIFGEDNMSDSLSVGFFWGTSVVKLSHTVELRDWDASHFWSNLHWLEENEVRKKYPELFELDSSVTLDNEGNKPIAPPHVDEELMERYLEGLSLLAPKEAKYILVSKTGYASWHVNMPRKSAILPKGWIAGTGGGHLCTLPSGLPMDWEQIIVKVKQHV